MAEIARAGGYAALYGPTTGDRVRLADTDLLIEVTEDRCGAPALAGDEAVFGGGKVIRESMGQSRATRAEGAPDTVITGAVVLDHWGVVKADVGIRDGRIVALGKAGNPDTMDGVHPGAGHRPVHRDHRRQRADPHRRRHRHPRALHRAAADPGGAGHRHHHAGRRRHRPGRGHQGHHRHPGRLLAGRDAGRARPHADQRRAARQGQHVSAEGLWEQLRAGAAGFKLHEDWGTTPAAIDACLTVADATGVQVAIHTDTLNEAGYVESTLAAIAGRPIHAYHTEGAGGGHAPGHHHGRRPPERAAVVDQPDPPAHRQHPRRAPRHADGLPPPELGRAGGPGLRRVPHPAVHDGRRGRAARPGRDLDHRLRLAGDGPDRRGDHPHLADGARDEAARAGRCPATAAADNQRARRYVAKYTIAPAVAHGLDGEIGSVGAGQAGRPGAVGPGVLRRAAAPGGQGRRDRVGDHGRRQRVDPDAAAAAAAPDVRRVRRAAGPAGCTFVAPAALEDGLPTAGRDRPLVAERTSSGSKADLPENDAMPRIEVDPDTFTVRIDGEVIEPEPAADCRWPSATSCSDGDR